MKFPKISLPNVADWFKPPNMNFVESEDDLVEPRQDADSLPFNRFASYLPYTAWDEENRLFAIEGNKPGKLEGWGFVLEVSPQLGSDQAMADYLSGLFTAGTSEGIGFQIQIFGSPDLDSFIQRMKAVTLRPEQVAPHLQEQARLHCMMVDERAEFYKRGATHDLYDNLNVRMRNYRCNISVVVPASDYNNEGPKAEARTVRANLVTMLQQYMLYEYAWSPEDLINYCSLILNPHRTLNYDFAQLTYDDSREIRDQIIAADTKAVESDDQIVYSSEGLPPVALRAMSTRSYPSFFTLPNVQEFLGSDTSTAIAYPCPFIITMCANSLNYDVEKGKTTLKAARAQQTAESPMGKLLPHLQEVNEDWKTVQRAFDEGVGTVKLTHQVLLMYATDDAERCEQSAKAVWRAKQFELTTDRKMQKQGLLASLPMMMGPLMQKDLSVAKRISTKTSINASNMMPILAEWRGTPIRQGDQFARPVMTLFGRKGQAIGIDIFANPSGNYNGCIVGTSGSGKSFAVNELTKRIMAIGGRVWIMDVGQSYKKSCALLGGQYIEIGNDGGDPSKVISFNPFQMVQDIDEEMELIKPLVAQMIAPTEPLGDYEMAQLDIHIRSVWYDKGQAGTITDLAKSLMNNCSNGGPNPLIDDPEYRQELANMSPKERQELCEPRVRDMGVRLFPFTEDGAYGKYFHGGRPIDFTSNFIVLEMEQLNAKKDLRAVVMFLLMYRITQEMYMGGRRQPKLVVIDEAWDLMAEGSSSSFIEAGYRRARKYGGSFFTATQSIGDYSKSAASMAALENADWMFLLRQKKESIEALQQSGKFILDDHLKTMLQSVKTVSGAYAEILVRGGDLPPVVGRLFTDPYSNIVNSTLPQDYTDVIDYVEKGQPMHEAVLSVLRDRGQYAH